MTNASRQSTIPHAEAESLSGLFDDWFDPIETAVRERVRGFIQVLIEDELEATLSRPRYGRLAKGDAALADAPGAVGHRHGHRPRSLLGSFGRVEIEVPRARLAEPDGKTSEWRSKVLPAYQRRTRVVDALIAGAYLAGTNTRRVRRAFDAVRRGGRQGHREPRVAQGADRLGGLERSLAGRGTDCAADPGRHDRAGPA